VLYRADTIVARATAPGRAAIAILRLSGSEAVEIAERLLHSDRPLRDLPPWTLARFSALDPADGCVIDEVLAVRMPAHRSYTSEDVVEIHCHGSTVVVDALLGAAMLVGARLAEPGEFTRRAVLNGRMDLVQAEAVADLIEAPVLSGAKAAWQRLSGALSRRILELRARLLSVLSNLEAHIDFSDEDLPEEDTGEQLQVLAEVSREIENLLGGFTTARREHEGFRVVLAGKPNVGKSSLLNALLGFERAIVSPEAGTTRDAIMETVDLRGLAFVITDTAGLRETSSASESLAVGRSRQEAANADILVRVFDGSCPLDDADLRVLQLPSTDGAGICVMNKSDLTPGLTAADRSRLDATGWALVSASALAACGGEELRHALVAVAQSLKADAGASAALGRERHRAALQRALVAILEARALIEHGEHAELASAELRSALTEIAGITEALDNEQVLDLIFASFCLGK
jgi:tRNA modification GTPase